MNQSFDCPVCRSSSTFSAFSYPRIDREHRNVMFRVHCYHCNHEWSETFVFSGRGSATPAPVLSGSFDPPE